MFCTVATQILFDVQKTVVCIDGEDKNVNVLNACIAKKVEPVCVGGCHGKSGYSWGHFSDNDI